MATGRTISANSLTDHDKKIISLCEDISDTFNNLIKDRINQLDFINKYSKISYTRDGGAGVGAGKLQRDALCTRGKQGLAPFSNRNLRWHPLVAAENSIDYAKEIDEIRIDGSDEQQTLIFIVNGKEYPSDEIHNLTERYVVLPKHWIKHKEKLRQWDIKLWTKNSCIIPASEACNWQDAVESYALLGIAIGVSFYNLDFDNLYTEIVKVIKNQEIDSSIYLPSSSFPTRKSVFISCPVCKVSIAAKAANFMPKVREPVWQPSWRNTKRSEGDDSSIQITHVNPLIESCLNHNAKNVRYGHRWCNISMTDHSLSETLDFMEYIINAHKRCK